VIADAAGALTTAVLLNILMWFTFAAIWSVLLPPLCFIVRLEWNRAAAVAGVIAVIAMPVLLFLPFKTHAVRLDMPRPYRVLPRGANN
jgi:hypothetical protein